MLGLFDDAKMGWLILKLKPHIDVKAGYLLAISSHFWMKPARNFPKMGILV
jgi:hypothetical protein